MATDYLGNPTTTTEPATRDAIDAFARGLVGYEMRILAVLAAARQDESSFLAALYAAMLCLLGETMEGPAKALPYLTRARSLAGYANDREQRLLCFVELWITDDLPAAQRVGEATLALYPRDLVLLKLLQYLAFIHGAPGAMLRASTISAEAADDVAHFHGMHAFALEECHLIGDARASAERALMIERKEPWAHHALAHIALSEARVAEGSRFLDSVEDSWTGLTSFMSTHLWWHRALFYLSEGAFDRVLALYDRNCWGSRQDLLTRPDRRRLAARRVSRWQASMSATAGRSLASTSPRAVRTCCSRSSRCNTSTVWPAPASPKQTGCWRRSNAVLPMRRTMPAPRGKALRSPQHAGSWRMRAESMCAQ